NFAGTEVKTETVFTYTNDALTGSTTFKKDPDGLFTVKVSESIYAGNEGEEKVQKTRNYNFAGTEVKTETVFTYTNDALTGSTSFKKDPNGLFTVKVSESIYAGNEGEEKVQKTRNYNFAGT